MFLVILVSNGRSPGILVTNCRARRRRIDFQRVVRTGHTAPDAALLLLSLLNMATLRLRAFQPRPTEGKNEVIALSRKKLRICFTAEELQRR